MAGEEQFGHYRLEHLLGRGGMGEVWRAADTRKNDRVVALKRLPPGLATEDDIRTRFMREAELTARLNEPHVIPIHDYGEIDGRLFIDMRLVEGMDLQALLLRDGPLAPSRAAAVVSQVADALDEAHATGLLHRDVKPSNVLLRRGRDDFVYLIDFGIAHNVGGTRLTASGSMVGTFAYMAPERFAEAGDHRVDVYALGCLLFETLTGQRPFAATNLPGFMNAHFNQPPPAPSESVDGIPAGIDEVVRRAMAKDPAERYASPGELATAARRALHPSSTPARRPSRPSPRPGRSVLDERGAPVPRVLRGTGMLPLSMQWAALRDDDSGGPELATGNGDGSICVFDAEAGTLVRSINEWDGAEQRRLEELTFGQHLAGILDDPYDRHVLAWSPAERRIASSAAGHFLPFLQGMVWDVRLARSVRELPHPRAPAGTGALNDLSWLPDGRLLGLVDGVIWDLDSGSWLPLHWPQGRRRAVHAFRVDRAGTRLAALCADTLVLRVWTLEEPGRAPIELFARGTAVFTTMDWSDDGFLAAGHTDGRTTVWDAGTGALLHVLSLAVDRPIESLSWRPGEAVLTACAGGVAVTWPAALGEGAPAVLGPGRSAAWSPDGRWLAVLRERIEMYDYSAPVRTHP